MNILKTHIFTCSRYIKTGFFLVLVAILFSQCHSSDSKQSETMKTYAIRLKPGQDLRKEIEAFVKKEQIEAGWIMSCAGSLTQKNIRYANQPEGKMEQGHFEIVSLTGTLSINGCHLHISTSDSLGNTTGGHLLENNIVYTTAEIIIGASSEMIFKREKDGTTPWEELQIITRKK